jgi:hypothetical protein
MFGHTCCTIHDCTMPLTDQQDRYCSVHIDQQYICCINGCQNRVDDGHLTCNIDSHRAFETARTDPAVRGALPLLRQRLRRAGVDDVPLAGSSGVATTGGNIPDHRSAIPRLSACAFDHDTSYSPASSTDGLKGRMSRRWTHNEQLFVYSCGVIASRATFFGSEGVSGVKVSESRLTS